MTRNAKNGQEGLTIIELMVALCLVAVLSLAVFGLMANLRRSYTTQNVAADVQESARAAIDYMAQDIRMAGYDPNAKADARIEAMTATGLRFTSDRNGNSEIEEIERERVTFTYDSANRRLLQTLYEGTAVAATEILLGNVNAAAFSYFDQAGTEITDMAEVGEVRTVEIMLTVEQPAGRDDPVQRTYSTRVKCRNMGL
jgi:type IV pilus assembly protein PilW